MILTSTLLMLVTCVAISSMCDNIMIIRSLREFVDMRVSFEIAVSYKIIDKTEMY